MVYTMAQYDSVWFPEHKEKFPIDEDPCPECGGKNCVEITGKGEYACKKCDQSWYCPDEQ